MASPISQNMTQDLQIIKLLTKDSFRCILLQAKGYIHCPCLHSLQFVSDECLAGGGLFQHANIVNLSALMHANIIITILNYIQRTSMQWNQTTSLLTNSVDYPENKRSIVSQII